MNPTPKFCTQCGQPLSSGAKFCAQCGHRVAASPAADVPAAHSAPPPASTPPPPPAYSTPPPPAPQRPPVPTPAPSVSAAPAPAASASAASAPKKQRGCLWGCLALLGVAFLIGCGVLAFSQLTQPISDNLSLGGREPITSETLPASGGTWVVDEPGSPIDGLTLSVPEGAYDGKRSFKISVRSIEGHKFGPAFNPATPLIHIDNGGAFAEEPMTVRIPVRVRPDEFAMAFYYDPHTGDLEGLPLVELAEDHVTVVTSHFSDMLVSTIPWELLENISVETDFAPGIDDWQFVNHGSAIAPKGHCAGQAVTAMWYYYERKVGAGDPALYGRYDNNDYRYRTIDFQWDDSWGYRFASVVQKELVDWDHLSRAFFKRMGTTSDRLTWNAFAYAMHLTGEPQYAAIYSGSGGHAIVAYKIEDGKIYVADPNYPGVQARFLRYENGSFLPYYSGENATAIAEEGEAAYTAIRYMAKSAMVNWSGVGTHYEKMVKGEVGEGIFPDYTLEYLSDFDETTSEYIWSPVPKVLELSEEDTAAPGERYRGKIAFRVTLPGHRSRTVLYEGTTHKRFGAGPVPLTAALTPGMQDMGIQVSTASGNTKLFVDFQRVRVLYEREDLSGVWEGSWQIEEAGGVLQFVEDMLTQIILWTGLAESEAQAREAAAAGIEQDPELYNPRPLRLEVTAVDPDKGDRYNIRVYLDDSGAFYEDEATYREGVFVFDSRSEDASRSFFTGELVGPDTLDGTFTTTAWGFFKDALTGGWSLQRVR